MSPVETAVAFALARSHTSAAPAPLRVVLAGQPSGVLLLLPLRRARDTLVALPVALLVAALACAVLLRERAPGTSRRGPSRRTGLLAGLAAVGVAATMGGSVRAADTGPGQPCPAGAPVKSFDVHAIDV